MDPIHQHAVDAAASRLGLSLEIQPGDYAIADGFEGMERLIERHGIERCHSWLKLIYARDGNGLPCVRRTT